MFSVTELRELDSSVLLRIPIDYRSHALGTIEVAATSDDPGPPQPAW
jgi:hypothetical protein